MGSKDDTAVATKLDIKMLMEMMGDLSLSIEKIREEAKETKLELRQEIKTSDEHMRYEFKLATEIIRNDLLDAKKDRVAQHDDTLADHTRRIVRIERKLAM